MEMNEEYQKKLIELAYDLEKLYESIDHKKWTILDEKIHYLIGFIKGSEEIK